MIHRICIMGAGPGGYTAAVRAAQQGAEVTLIEKADPGGTCLNWGCIPSKVLITTAELFERFHQAADFGIDLQGDIRVDMARLMARKEKIIADQIKGLHTLFDHHRIRYIKGQGQILKTGVVEIPQPEGPSLVAEWDRLILATGSSQFAFLAALGRITTVDWDRISVFHLDEYVGMSDRHPASFRRYLRERILDEVRPAQIHFLEGDAPDLEAAK